MSEPRATPADRPALTFGLPAQGAAGQFSIDLERAPQAIRDLEDARDQLSNLRTEVATLGHVRPPAKDQVSIDAAHALEAVAVGEQGSFAQALEGGINQLEQLINSMRQELQIYSSTEAANTRIVRETG